MRYFNLFSMVITSKKVIRTGLLVSLSLGKDVRGNQGAHYGSDLNTVQALSVFLIIIHLLNASLTIYL